MRYLLLPLLLIFPALASAQELHTFSNGEVADAEKINENFEALKSEISGSGGCSAEQDGSSVVITCADGTSGVLAGAGTVVVYPEGVTGDQPPVTVNSGDIVLVDGNGIILGKASSGSSGYFLENGDTGFLMTVNNAATTETVIMAGCRGCDLWYTDEECTNGPFIRRNESYIYRLDDTFLIPVPDAEGAELLLKGYRRGAHYRYGELQESRPCGSAMETMQVTVPAVFNLPTEWSSAAYPVRLEQLP